MILKTSWDFGFKTHNQSFGTTWP